MKTPVAPETERGVAEELKRATLEPDALKREHFVESWLQDHLNVVACAVVAAGFGLRLFVASRTFLNPDEILHYMLFNEPSVWLAYKASLTNAHPPLIFLILYFWRFLGHSEIVLRFPSVILGTACCWMAFKWVGTVFGKAASMIALVLFTFAPAMIALSAEVRGYALLLFCIVTALYFLARAFEEKSASKMWLFSIFLYLSILSHYSAVFFVVAVGLHCLARIVDRQIPQKVVLAWVAGQIVALAIYVFLYVTHVSKLKNSITVWAMPYDTSYFHPDVGNIFTFTWVNTLNIFLFLYGQQYLAGIMLLLFVVSVAYLFGKELLVRKGDVQSSRLGILLLFPFIAVWGAALTGIYPYVGSRHTAFLAPFAIAGASFLLAKISRQQLWAGFLVVTLLMAWSTASARPRNSDPPTADLSPGVMASAVTYMNQIIPRGDHILVDFQSGLPIRYYFCGPQILYPIETFDKEYLEFTCHENPIISLKIWKLVPQSFSTQFEGMARTHMLRPGDRVWVYQSGWGANLDTELGKYDDRFRCLSSKSFGGNATVILFVVGPDLQPTSPPRTCENRPTNGSI